MIGEKALIYRVIVAKTVGLAIGLVGFIVLPIIYPDTAVTIKWGLLLWYITFGAIIGTFGVFNRHPIFKFSLPWYIRGPLIGAWLNFVLALFAYNQLEEILLEVFKNGFLKSPFWIVAEGAFLGLIIDCLATKLRQKRKTTNHNKKSQRGRSRSRNYFLKS